MAVLEAERFAPLGGHVFFFFWFGDGRVLRVVLYRHGVFGRGWSERGEFSVLFFFFGGEGLAFIKGWMIDFSELGR